MEKSEVLNLADILGRMKGLKRTGWVRRKVANPETDAEHSYSLAMLVMLFAPAYLDRYRCLQLALIHDLPEVFCGDFAPGDIDPQQKSDLEDAAMNTLVDRLKMPELTDLFDEFNQLRTPEAEFVWVLDRLDNVFTARFYEDTQKIELVREFAESTFERLHYLKDDKLRTELNKVLSALIEK